MSGPTECCNKAAWWRDRVTEQDARIACLLRLCDDFGATMPTSVVRAALTTDAWVSA